MPRKPDERASQAKDMFLNGKKLVEIASQLNLSEGTIRRWKSTYKWEFEHSEKAIGCSQRRRGGQPGNKNAIGHGGTGPPGNKNAVKTGEFETLFFDGLNQEEHQLLDVIQPNKKQLLMQEIKLLTVREYRMLKRINEIRAQEECNDNIQLIQVIEEALTRVQAKQQRAIETLHKFNFDDARLKLLKAQTERLTRESHDDDGENGVEIINDAPKETS